MLVLSRHRNEVVVLPGVAGGKDVEICLVDIRGDKVRLGITAPRGCPVHRQEVWERILAERPEAGFRPPDAEAVLQKVTAILERPEVLLAIPSPFRRQLSELIHGEGVRPESPSEEG